MQGRPEGRPHLLMNPERVIVGLGNPGQKYARTRHNAGFMAADALARERGVREWRRECESLVCSTEIAGTQVAIAKPLTYMNLSGHAVELLLAHYSLSPRELVVVLDDLNLPFGGIRIRERGSAGGHHGLESILRSLATDEVPRIRLGIGEENAPADKAEFVLAEFPPDRDQILDGMISRAARAVEMMIADGIEKTMSVFNAQEKEKQL